eukprot:1162038-Pelagomonas_calceolata.AAC.2
MRGELMWIGWVSGSTLLQGTSVMMGVLFSMARLVECRQSPPQPGPCQPDPFGCLKSRQCARVYAKSL